MQKKILSSLSMIIAGAMVMISCNKMDNAANDESSIITDSPESTTILSFDSEADFLAAVQSVRSGIATKSTGVEDFKSLYDEFNQAMAEADDYYQREGGYEEFKAKFPDLYYPEYEEDYAAFLPVSDEAIAKLLNTRGEVMIAGKEVDYRDVWSYERIVELGLGMPEYENLTSPETKALSDFVTLTEEKQTINSKRKAWITLRGVAIDDIQFQGKVGRVDLCFRKKGVLGWYNGQLTSKSYVITGHAPAPSTEVYKSYYIGGAKELEYSPHKYVVAIRPLSATSSSFGTRTFYFEFGLEDLTYSFTGTFMTDVDALLAMNNGAGVGEDLASAFSFRDVVKETFGNNNPYNWYVFGYNN